MKPIAKIKTEFGAKFGVPRQSGLVKELRGEIIFEPAYRKKEALLGIEEFSHLWLIWEFSENVDKPWSPTVYPPRLGGKEKRGVFATRSPFRPNPLGLSCVKIEKVIYDGEDAPKIIVSGADLMDGTPIFDIKPYLPYTDCVPDAKGGFGQEHRLDGIEVHFPEDLMRRLPQDKQAAAMEVLKQDPRAAYNKQPNFIYGMEFAGYDIRFRAEDDRLTVVDVVAINKNLSKIK